MVDWQMVDFDRQAGAFSGGVGRIAEFCIVFNQHDDYRLPAIF